MSSKNKEKRRPKTAEQQITEQQALPKEIREICARCPFQELRPVKFQSWVKELVAASRRKGLSDETIRTLVRNYGAACYWHQQQIHAALVDYGLASESLGSGVSSDASVGFKLQTVTRLIYAMTSLDELALLKAETRDDLEKKTRAYRLDYAARLSEYEINQHIGEMQKLSTLLSIWVDGLRDRKIALKKQAISE